MVLLICAILKNGKNELIYETKIESMQKTNLQLSGEIGGIGINWEIGIAINLLLYIKHN